VSKERKGNSFIKKPIYPGGTPAYRKFIKDNLKYPKAAKEKKIEGVVFLKYTIDHKGKVIEAQVIKGIGHGCDEEAKRIVKSLQFEIPKGPRKLRVTFHKKTQITFRLPKEKTAPQPKPKAPAKKAAPSKMKLVYQYTPTATPSVNQKSRKQKGDKKRSYSYTISGKFR